MSTTIIEESKKRIAESIQSAIDEQGSIRSFAEKLGKKHPHVIRILSSKNASIKSILEILYALDLELVIQPKSTSSEVVNQDINK